MTKNLNLLITYFSEHEKASDVIAVSETWLKDGEIVVINGFSAFSIPRDTQSRGGGAAAFVKIGHTVTTMPSVSCRSADLEALFVREVCSLTIGVAYRPPNFNLASSLYKLKTMLSTLTLNNDARVVIVGDFNIDPCGPTNEDYQYLLDKFPQPNTMPTGLTSMPATLIDHALANIPTGVRAGIFNELIADHLDVFLKLEHRIDN